MKTKQVFGTPPRSKEFAKVSADFSWTLGFYSFMFNGVVYRKERPLHAVQVVGSVIPDMMAGFVTARLCPRELQHYCCDLYGQ